MTNQTNTAKVPIWPINVRVTFTLRYLVHALQESPIEYFKVKHAHAFLIRSKSDAHPRNIPPHRAVLASDRSCRSAQERIRQREPHRNTQHYEWERFHQATGKQHLSQQLWT